MPEREEVHDEIVHLDYAELRDKNFHKCKLVYNGGGPPVLINCDFVNCRFIFEGPANHTLVFLSNLAASGGDGAEMVVQKFLGLENWEQKGE